MIKPKEKKKLYIFRIGRNVKIWKGAQKELRNEVIRLLKVAPVYFSLSKCEDKERRILPKQEFVFETQEEARWMALKFLETETFFFCELFERSVE